MKASRWLLLLVLLLTTSSSANAADEPLRIATFQIDATPPLGSPLCNGGVKPAKEIVTPLTARGVVLLGSGDPIVLCAFDWVGIANESNTAFREAIAQAVGTSPVRVAVHTLHQHDAPGSDFATERLLQVHGLEGQFANAAFDRDVMQRLAAAAQKSLANAQPVTHIGLGTGEVEKVASNRRILGADGKVALQRQSSGGRNPAARAAPEGVIDPLVRLIAFWNGERPVAVLTYYATHPQSYYGQGFVNWDFVGMAREARAESLPGVSQIHFNGAGGNVAAGKYNDGAPSNRLVLAQRLAAGMKRAWEAQQKQPITASEVRWQIAPVALPVRDTLEETALLARLQDPDQPSAARIRAARDLIFLRRMQAGYLTPISCLKLGTARVLHLPGELFVEYQLAAQQMQPDAFVALAAYGDYGPGYIGTEVAYGQGGYETGIVSRVAPQVEAVLLGAMRSLLRQDPSPPFYPDKMKLLEWQDEQGKTHAVEDAAGWERRRAHILENMELVMGRLPDRDPALPLDIQVLESERLEKVTRQKITYVASAGDRVPAYLLIPHELKNPAPAMVCLHGTSGPRGRTAGVGPDYPRYTLELAERGYVTIAPDYTLLGDNQTDPEALGYTSGTMKGIFCHMRAIDLLESLPEVDQNRIGCCGVSLGGHNSLFLAAFDPRLKVVVTSSGFDSFHDYMNGNLTGWCQKRYMPAIAEVYGKDPARVPFDFPEVLAAIAPRALYVHAPLDDSNFKVDSARRCVDAAAAVYELLGAEQQLVAVYPPGPHGYPSEEREKSYAFIDRVLKGDRPQ